jgi:hypothetical protein
MSTKDEAIRAEETALYQWQPIQTLCCMVLELSAGHSVRQPEQKNKKHLPSDQKIRRSVYPYTG